MAEIFCPFFGIYSTFLHFFQQCIGISALSFHTAFSAGNAIFLVENVKAQAVQSPHGCGHKALPKAAPLKCWLPVSAARGKEDEEWMKGMGGVMGYGECFAGGGSVHKGLQVGSGGTNYLR